MREAAHEIALSGSNPCKAVLGWKPPGDLVRVARAFLDLQQARHEADYGLAKRFTRSDVLAHITQAEDAVRAWDRIRSARESEAFMVALLVPLRRT